MTDTIRAATIRDLFAGLTLLGMQSANSYPGSRKGESDIEALARFCYEVSDAMLEARAKGGVEHREFPL